ncbi:hypothetical protein EKG83_38030 [Saccharothrix syringae]|uniref:Integrase catalytic domain-containing protein n=1 Tax=Saccharothrix syringae TaxID=103733 RepID=A0A5Q0HFI3_SACSY|nr:hypothetical protein EKG83_38030 [Saccharothrix syringae]
MARGGARRVLQPDRGLEDQRRYCDTDLVLGALEYAIWSRDVRDGQLIHHSDRGSTYTAFRFAKRLADNRILPSMGSVGDSYDNALMENFFSTLKIELVYRRSWRTRGEAEKDIAARETGTPWPTPSNSRPPPSSRSPKWRTSRPTTPWPGPWASTAPP